MSEKENKPKFDISKLKTVIEPIADINNRRYFQSVITVIPENNSRSKNRSITMQQKSAFTLIELLVVIAIIGILSSVVLASLNTARAKGADAAIKANLANIRAEAAIVYDGNNCYADAQTAGACSATAFAAAACAATAGTLPHRR